jgi:hypothetical protein
MSRTLQVDDIMSYLAHRGWHRSDETWRSASIWRHDRAEVLVPARDGLGDAAARVRDIVDTLAEVEGRGADTIARDIDWAQTDTQSYRLHTVGSMPGAVPLREQIDALRAVQRLVGSAGRVVAEGPRASFTGGPPRVVTNVLDTVHLDASEQSPHELFVRIPAGPVEGSVVPIGREVTRQVHEALTVLNDTVRHFVVEAGVVAFDQTVTAGVSAELCDAVSRLGGRDRENRFVVGFGWGHGLGPALPTEPLDFPRGTGVILHEVATRLRGIDSAGLATISGLVESLHGDPAAERWRLKIRGELLNERGERRTRRVWVRLADRSEYDRAIAAHREGQAVEASGTLRVRPRVEIEVEPGMFRIDP